MEDISQDAAENPDHDPVLQALKDLAGALQANTERNRAILERIDVVTRLRDQGCSYREIVTNQNRPLIVEMATANLKALLAEGSRVRRVEARALYDEGLTMERIAQLFGVTRQRVSELLRKTPSETSRPAAA